MCGVGVTGDIASAPSFFPTATGKWGFLPDDVHDLLLPHMTQPKQGDAYDCPFTNIHNNWLVTPRPSRPP
jgi:O-methyltransferase/aklanonic acid methyltransferase